MKALPILSLFLALFACTTSEKPDSGRPATFTHGVASGDPDSVSVVLWTRAVPEDSSSLTIAWEVSETDDFGEVIRKGTVTSDEASDYTFKVIADSLKPGTRYYYRFVSGDSLSATGRTRTAPSGTTKDVRFAVASCSNFEWGYFNAYDRMADIEDLDAVLHLGDYIYEYGIGTYGDTTLGRLHDPAHEILTVEDYRTRYAQYRSDPDLQRLHRVHPFITIWDDHEIANNAYVTGAQNHQEEEGEYMERRATARQVYYEWMPVREQNDLYRAFRFGNLVDLLMLDERLAGRSEQVESPASEDYADSTRSMLGKVQYDWLEDQLRDSRTRWQVIGNQVIFSYLNWSDSGVTRNMDAWDGYPAEQGRLAGLFRELDKNIIIVTGDTHSSWAFEVVTDPFSGYDPENAEGALAIEFGVTSINSANSNESYPDEAVREREKIITGPPVNPHLKYSNLREHGFLLLHLEADQGRAEFHFVETVKEPDDESYVEEVFYFNAGENNLSKAPGNSTGE